MKTVNREICQCGGEEETKRRQEDDFVCGVCRRLMKEGEFHGKEGSGSRRHDDAEGYGNDSSKGRNI
ncbi:MAG: hypothetical protein HFI57_10095 [Lachnospiraceae bacterium]|nr:hypothetical protein [Lachnospiraceae bacterium]